MTRHVEIRLWFPRDLKELGILKGFRHPEADNSSEFFTKNLPGPLFEKHTALYCSVGEYIKKVNIEDSQGESIWAAQAQSGLVGPRLDTEVHFNL